MISDWFEYTVNPSDSTNITLRRLSAEEIAAAQMEYARQLAEGLRSSPIDLFRATRAFYRQLRAEGLLDTPRGLSPRRAARRRHNRKLKRR